MNLFDLPAAQSFAQGFSPASGLSRQSPDEVLRGYSRQTVLPEGTQAYSEARAALMRHAEIGLLLAASNVRRSLELMRTASSTWAQVTLYYGAWHASSAILAMLGGYIGRKWWIGVERNTVGNLALLASSTQLNLETSHRRFWIQFYDLIQVFEPWIDAAHKGATMPVNGDSLWMTTERNLVNYQHFIAEEQTASFATTFDETSFPSCLSGSLATQYHVSIGLLGLAMWLADSVSLTSDMLSRMGVPGPRSNVIAELVDRAPLPRISDSQLDILLAP